jgi:hypothetical protein
LVINLWIRELGTVITHGKISELFVRLRLLNTYRH